MTQNNIILVLSCLGIAQALFLSFYLITLKKGNRKANVFLALIILGLTIRIGKSILNVYLQLEPWQRNLGLSGILLAGPALWFYGQTILMTKKKFVAKEYLHFLPMVFFVLCSPIVPNDGSAISYVVYILIFLHLATYLVLSFNLFASHYKNLHNSPAEWYRNLAIGVALIWLFYMGNLAGLFSYYIGGALSFSFLIYIFSFLFLKKHAFQLNKYTLSTLDKSTSESLIASLKKLFREEELYLDSTLTLENLASRLNVPPRKLSQAINENEQKNFSDFVSGYRIEKAKCLLVDPEYREQKIIAIAYDCGFGNITSFNLAFKAKTKRTPSQYRKEFTSS